ncbi:MAG: hypothetical protein JWM74_1356 [Myxococcaceae bacterium]|nr:hypothetical protein [Myxococcaceae bacterium]
MRLEFVCDVDWSSLPVVDGKRWCNRCERSVHDLGLLTEDEAQPILREREQQRVCVVYRPKADGSIRFRNPASLALAASVLAACNAPSAGPDPTPVTASAVASVAAPVPTVTVATSDTASDPLATISDAGADARATALHGKDAAACSPLAHATKSKQGKLAKKPDPMELGGY